MEKAPLRYSRTMRSLSKGMLRMMPFNKIIPWEKRDIRTATPRKTFVPKFRKDSPMIVAEISDGMINSGNWSSSTRKMYDTRRNKIHACFHWGTAYVFFESNIAASSTKNPWSSSKSSSLSSSSSGGCWWSRAASKALEESSPSSSSRWRKSRSDFSTMSATTLLLLFWSWALSSFLPLAPTESMKWSVTWSLTCFLRVAISSMALSTVSLTTRR
mmetsp:Transcript_30394/g.97974  ORF Transcript_30394/g.97974 Transcript_30394/m.97974 type:complete len:215 (-) Transcript_30394:1670-2314(-)